MFPRMEEEEKMQMFWVVLYGVIGGILFLWMKIPGGEIIGSAVAVIAYLILSHTPDAARPQIPPLLASATYIAMGIIIGCMFKPELLSLFWQHWQQVLLSTVILFAGGLLGAIVLYKCGLLSPVGAYLAASPGGLNAAMGVAAGMSGEETPIILLCHMVRLYTILLTAPLIGKILEWLFKS